MLHADPSFVSLYSGSARFAKYNLTASGVKRPFLSVICSSRLVEWGSAAQLSLRMLNQPAPYCFVPILRGATASRKGKMMKIKNVKFKLEKERKNYYHINITFAGWTS
ncbi:hypothetical protein [Geobacillus sp. BK01]|uniref:hypothetical protein n=1 Tax=Geobacillus sp. BK01 TaxID=3457328 RepID=UPI003FA56166